jgi:uroporphyrinogen-III synthase
VAEGEPTPLAGVRVVVTRPALQAGGLCAAFAAAGAVVERLPMVDVVAPSDPEPLLRAVAEIGRYRWLAFSSANAVTALVAARQRSPAPDDDADRRAARSPSPRGSQSATLGDAGAPHPVWPPGVRAAVVGEATARALRDAGLEPSLVASGGTGASLAEDMAAADPELAGAAVLLPLAADARPDLAEGLAAAGAEVDAVIAYDKRAPAGTAGRARNLFPPGRPLGWVTFTSPRIARTFAELLDRLGDDEPFQGWALRRPSLLAASIGPTTTATLRRLGVEPAAEAVSPGDRELVAAVIAAQRRR